MNYNDYIKEELVELNVFELEEHDIAKTQPLMSDEEYEEFREDLALKGQLEPISVIEIVNPKSSYKYKIVDGRHRVRAIKELEVGIVKAKVFKSTTSKQILYDYSESIHKRRNLTVDQKALKAYLFWKKNNELNKHNRKDRMTQEEVAKKFGISKQQLSYFSTIENYLPKSSKWEDAIWNRKSITFMGKRFSNARGIYLYIQEQKKKLTEDNIKNIMEKILKDINIDTNNKSVIKAMNLVKTIDEAFNELHEDKDVRDVYYAFFKEPKFKKVLLSKINNTKNKEERKWKI